jgi:hypothetical protein
VEILSSALYPAERDITRCGEPATHYVDPPDSVGSWACDEHTDEVVRAHDAGAVEVDCLAANEGRSCGCATCGLRAEAEVDAMAAGVQP